MRQAVGLVLAVVMLVALVQSGYVAETFQKLIAFYSG
jgi:hypothetical protein